MASVKATIDSKIKSKKVMMFSKTHCPFCTKAKKAFQALLENGSLSSEDYEVEEIEGNPDCSAIQDYLGQLTGARSVPRVFINGKFIGGGDEVDALARSQKLAPMLKP